jgi:hypothetical protein
MGFVVPWLQRRLGRPYRPQEAALGRRQGGEGRATDSGRNAGCVRAEQLCPDFHRRCSAYGPVVIQHSLGEGRG